MKTKTITASFFVFLVLSVISRFIQILYTVDYTTGFFKSSSKNFGISLSLVTVIACVVCAIFAFKVYKKPENAPKQNFILELSSLAFAIVLGVELFTEKLSVRILPWQQLGLKIFGLLTVVYFAIFAFCSTSKLNKIRILSIVPIVYFLMRLICAFITVSSLSIISDNVLLIASYCLIVLFMLNFAKLYNGIETDTNFRKLLATGLTCGLITFTKAVPNIVLNLIKPNFYTRTQLISSISLLFCGLFILVFVFSYFSKKNCE